MTVRREIAESRCEPKDVMIVAEGGAEWEAGHLYEPMNAQVEANVCQFLPFVNVVSDKRQLIVTNRDPVSHDIQGYAYDQAGVDIVLHRPSLKASLHAEWGVWDRQPALCCDRPGWRISHR